MSYQTFISGLLTISCRALYIVTSNNRSQKNKWRTVVQRYECRKKSCESSLLMLFKAENVVDSLDEEEDERLPRDQVPDPVKQLTVQQMRLFPRVAEELFEVDLLLAVRAGLLLADDQPSTYAKPKELIQLERVIIWKTRLTHGTHDRMLICRYLR